MSFINKNLQLIYISIPKNASTSLASILHSFSFENITLKRIDFDEFCEFKNNIHSTNKRPYSIHAKGIYRYFETAFDNHTLLCSQEEWNSYTKMAFVRNPYDRFVSAFCFFIEKDMMVYREMADFIGCKDNCTDIIFSHAFITQYEHLVSAEGVLKIDYIGKVENLHEEMYNILLKHVYNLNIPQPIFIERICKDKLNTSTKKKYYEYFDETTLKWVNEYFQKDFECFGYKVCNTIEELKEEYEKNVVDDASFLAKNNELILQNKERHFLYHVLATQTEDKP